MNRKNILFIHFYFTSLNCYGNTRHLDYFNYLSKNHNITIVTSKNNHFRNRKSKLSINNKFLKIIEIDNISYNNNLFRLISILQFCLILSTKYLFLFKKNKYVFSTTPDLIVSFFSTYLAKIYKIKNILEVRDVWPETLITHKNISKINPIYLIFLYLEIYVYKNSSVIISNLKYFKIRLKEVKINKKLVYLPDLNILKFNKKASNITSIKNDKINFIYCGTDNNANNFQVIYEFINKISLTNNKLRFHIFLYNPKKKYKSLKSVNFKYQKSMKSVLNFIKKNQIDFGLTAIDYKPLYKYGCSPRKYNLYQNLNIQNINLCTKKNLKHDFWKNSININYLNHNSSFLDFKNISKIKPKHKNSSSFNNKIKSKLNRLFI